MTSPHPYERVADKLRADIQQGTYTDRMPPETALMKTYSTGHTTLRRALKLLENEGRVEPVQGVGWFIAGTGDRRRVADRLRDALTDPRTAERLAPDGNLPGEMDLCTEFGVSRTAIRTALALLEGEGLIARMPRGRALLHRP